MESWEKELQNNLLQKAVNTEFGYNMPFDDLFEKAAPIGTRKTWQGGREFVKTAEGWKPVPKKDRQLKPEEDKSQGKSTDLIWKKSDEFAGGYESTYKNSKLLIYPGNTGFVLSVDGKAITKGSLTVCKGAAQDLVKKTEKKSDELKKDPFINPEPKKEEFSDSTPIMMTQTKGKEIKKGITGIQYF